MPWWPPEARMPLYPPDWQSASYRAVLVKENGQWRIRSLTLVQTLTEE